MEHEHDVVGGDVDVALDPVRAVADGSLERRERVFGKGGGRAAMAPARLQTS